MINYRLVAKSFILFYSICLVIILGISSIYYYNFNFVVKKHDLVTPIMINATTKTLTSPRLKNLFTKMNPFGFIFYKENIESYDQVKKLNQDLRALFPNRVLYIAIDHEGGLVDRLRGIAKEKNLVLLKKASYYGQIAKTNLKKAKQEIYKDSRVTAKLLSELGFNLNLAPMLDIASNEKDSRTYSQNPQIVYELGREFIRGMQDEGIMVTLKHLPGIGRSTKDTHDEAVYIHAYKDELRQKDLIPFNKLAKVAQFGMITHAIFSKIDDKPATISKKTIDFVKKETGFEGLLISDALNMKAVSKDSSYKENARQSFLAGIDIIIPNCSDHYCDASVLKAAEETSKIEKFNEKLSRLEEQWKLRQ